MNDNHYLLFETALGCCGIAWNACGVSAVSFPADDEDKVRARLLRHAPGAAKAETPPPEVMRLKDDIVALLAGERRDFDGAGLDYSGLADFDRQVYAHALEIKHGETKTYGDIARAMGDVSLSRRVGQSLGRNPFPIIVPCHRVVGAGGTMTGFSAPGGTDAKRRILKIEGAIGPDLFDAMNAS